MRLVYGIILSLLAGACEAELKPEIGYNQAVLTEERCRAKPTYSGCPDFLNEIDSKSLALQGISPINAAEYMQIKIFGSGFDQRLLLSIEGEDVPVYVTSPDEAFFLTPKFETSGKKNGLLKKLNGRFEFSFYFLSEDLMSLPSLASPELACQGEARMASDGSILVGTQDCGNYSKDAHSVCSKDGEVGCIASLTYPAINIANLAENLLSGVKVGGVAGTLTLPLASAVRSSQGAYGVGGTGSMPTLADCAADAEVGCVVVGPSMASTLVTGASGKILFGQALAGISGTATLPAANKVLTGTSYGVGGTTLSGSLTLPSVQNVRAGSGPYGDSLAALSPTLTLPALGKVLSGTSYGVAGTGSAGTLTLPLVAHVQSGSGSYGDPGSALSPIYSPDFPSASNVRSGDTVNGVVGTLDDCSAANQSDCVATTIFKTMNLAAAGTDTSLTAGNFNSTIKTAGNFEFWDALGVRHSIAGDVDLVAANIKDAVVIFGVTGALTLAPPNCSADGESNCLVDGSSYGAAPLVGLASKILLGQTGAGVAGNVALPTLGKVLSGTSYGVAGNGSTGTLTLPLAANVMNGSGVYGDPGAAVTPVYSADFPSVSNVLSTDTVNNVSGTLTLPAAGKVLTGTSYGTSGNGSTGTLTLPLAANVLTGSGTYGDPGSAVTPGYSPDFPAAANVLSSDTVDNAAGTLTLPAVGKVLTGTSYGTSGNGSTGTLTLPSAANVLTGSGTYGDPGSAATPSYSPDFPAVANVLSSDTVDNAAGTLTLPAVGKVLTATSYGVGGNGLTGTLTLPSAANVLTGSGTYGDPGSALTPSYSPDFPTAANVLSTDTVDGASGTLTLPAVGKVMTGTSYGVGGNGSSGTLSLPAASAVRASAGTYGDPGSAVTASLADCADTEAGCYVVGPNFKAAAVVAGTGDKILFGQSIAGVSGTVTLPLAPKVLTGTSYGIGGNAITGSLTLPAAGNVLSSSGVYGDALSQTTPTLTLPAVGKVLTGTSFGTSGTGSTGTLTLPTAGNVLASSSSYGDAASQTSPTYVCPSYVRPAAPTIASTTFALSPDRVTLTWNAVSGVSGYIVVMRSGAAVSWTPTDGQSYTTGTQGSDTIIYSGTGTTVTYNTDATAGITYHFAVYSYIANNIWSYLPATSSETSCAGLSGSWVNVPGDSTYSTNGFCVMKYEARNVSGVATSEASGSPWVWISQTAAMAACANLGSTVHLITNNEWMTLATNIANVASNWSGAAVGSGAMNRGHSDSSPNWACGASSDDTYAYVQSNCTSLNSGTWSQKRTHTLSTGAVVWDLAGNVWDWTSYVISDNNAKPYISADGSPQIAWREFSAVDSGFTAMTLHDLRPINSEKSFWSDSWNSNQGIGEYLAGSNGSGGALRRGTDWVHGSISGIFSAYLHYASSHSASNHGFRCAAASP